MHKIAYCKTLISLLFASVFKDKQGIPWWLGLSYKGIFQYDHQDKVKPRKVSCLCTTFSLFPTVFFIYWVLIFRYNTNNVILSGAIESRNVLLPFLLFFLSYHQCTLFLVDAPTGWSVGAFLDSRLTQVVFMALISGFLLGLIEY